MARGRRIINLVPPVKGVHKGMPADAAPDLTAPDSRNVVDISPVEQKRTIAKRDGHRKAFINPAGGGAGSRVTGLGTALRSAGQTQDEAGVYTAFVDPFSSYNFPNPVAGPGFNYFTGSDLRGNYVRFSKKASDYSADKWQGTVNIPGIWIGVVRGGGLPDHLQFRSTFGDGYDNIGVVRTWDGGNDLALTMDCYRRARSVDLVDCTNFGPVVRGHPSFGYYVWAYLARQSENVVRLRIEGVRGPNTETIVESADISLSGSDQRSDNCQIRLEATSVALKATLTWPDELGVDPVEIGNASEFGVKTVWLEYTGAVGTFQAGLQVTQATSNARGYVLQRVQSGAAGYLQIYVTSGTFDGTNGIIQAVTTATATAARVSSINNARQGINFRNPGTTAASSESGYFYRRATRLSGSDRRLTDPEVIAECIGSFQLSAGGRYQIPPNWEGYLIDGVSGNTERVFAGQQGYSSNTRPSVPCVDTLNDYVLDGDSSPSAVNSRFKRTSILTIQVWDTTPPSEFLDIREKFRNVTSAEDDGFGAAFLLKNLHA